MRQRGARACVVCMVVWERLSGLHLYAFVSPLVVSARLASRIGALAKRLPHTACCVAVYRLLYCLLLLVRAAA